MSFPLERFVDQKAASELQCPICLEVSPSVCETLICGHLFCEGCLAQVRNSVGNKCPSCNSVITGQQQALFCRRQIQNLVVKCSNAGYGCAATHALTNDEKHRAVCDFEQLACACGQRVARRAHPEHAASVCPLRPVRCGICAQWTPFRDAERHGSVCPEAKTQCGNAGCGAALLRKQLAAHREICAFERLECPWPGYRGIPYWSARTYRACVV